MGNVSNFLEYFFDEELEFKKAVINGATNKELASIFNLSENKVRKLKKVLQIENIRGIKIHKSKLMNIKEPMKAYSIGFLFNRIYIEVGRAYPFYEISYTQKQRNTMLKILEELEFDGDEYVDIAQHRYYVYPNNPDLIHLIKMYGGEIGKRQPRNFPMLRVKSLWKDFLRGYIDSGGGVLCPNAKFPYIRIYGSKGFLNSCIYYFNLQGKVKINVDNGGVLYIRITGKKMKSVVETVYYKDSITTEENFLKSQKLLGVLDGE